MPSPYGDLRDMRDIRPLGRKANKQKQKIDKTADSKWNKSNNEEVHHALQQ